jgi:hypothetical protein
MNMNLRAAITRHKEENREPQTVLDMLEKSMNDEYYEDFKKFVIENFGSGDAIDDDTLRTALVSGIVKGAKDLATGVEKILLSYELIKLGTRFAEERNLNSLATGETREGTDLLVSLIESVLKQIDLGLFDESSINFICKERQAGRTPQQDVDV